MPAPVPPPPPQPTEAQTRQAVRLVALLAAVAVGLVWLNSLLYRVDGPMVAYGRSNSASWNLWKLHRLDVGALRAHEGGRVTWLVGSSILRETFDEQVLNEALQEQGSEWRVAKFGQTRSAAGVSAGMVAKLPLRPGDRVVHNVAVENYRRNWLEFSELPGWRVSMMSTPSDLWDIAEWSVPARLEELAAVPSTFYQFHEEHLDGLVRWLRSPLDGIPTRRTRSVLVRFHTWEVNPAIERVRSMGDDSRNYMAAGELDLDPGQFNIDGIQRMRELCAAMGVDLVLADIPPRQEYMITYVEPEVREAWWAWLDEQSEVMHFPQLPEEDYYDMRHPNFRGREAHTKYLARWLKTPVRGETEVLHWTPSGDEPE